MPAASSTSPEVIYDNLLQIGEAAHQYVAEKEGDAKAKKGEKGKKADAKGKKGKKKDGKKDAKAAKEDDKEAKKAAKVCHNHILSQCSCLG